MENICVCVGQKQERHDIAKFKQSESAPMNKPSIESAMQRESDSKSIENILDELIKRQPREDNLLYIMSIESDQSRNKRGSDILDKLDEQKRYSISNRNSTEMAGEERAGSFGVAGGSAQSLRTPVPVQIHRSNALGEREEHSCDCYRTCLGENCTCFQFLEQCIPTRCCNKCIEMKNQMISEYIRQQETVYNLYTQPLSYMQYGMQSQAFLGPSREPHPPVRPIYAQELPIYPQETAEPTNNEQEDTFSCACKKTRCLKMYCECFTRKGFCSALCSCEDCLNRQDSEVRRKALAESIRELDRGCHCKKTKCDKKYCKCFAAGDKCSKFCTCENCLNMSEELRTLRKGSQEQAEEIKMEAEPPQQRVRTEPCSELPRDIEFDLPDFTNFNMNDT